MGTKSPILAYAKYSTYYIMDKRICLNDLDPTAIATHFSDVMIFCFVNDCYGSFMSETSVHKTNSRMGRQNKDKEKLRDSLMQISGCVLILFFYINSNSIIDKSPFAMEEFSKVGTR